MILQCAGDNLGSRCRIPVHQDNNGIALTGFATACAIDLIREARSARSDGGPKCLLVPSRVDVRTASGRDIESALKKLDESMSPIIHQRSAFVDAFTVGRWIGDFAPNGNAYKDIVLLGKKVVRELKP